MGLSRPNLRFRSASASASPRWAARATSISAASNTSAAATRRRCKRKRSKSSTRRGRPACAGSTPRARTARPSEEFLGAWLRERGIKPSEVCVSSKWGYRYNAGWRVTTDGEPHEIKDHSLAHLRSQTLETAALIGEYVDLYQIHSATLDSGVLDDEAVLAELRAIKAERGWRIGASVSSPAQADVVAKALEAGGDEKLFDALQVTYDVLEQGPHDALVRAAEAGVDIIVKEAMANGRALDRSAPLGRVTRTSASNLGADACARRLADDPDLLAELMRACRQDGAAYWKDRGALAWN
ncbi:Aldo/keto reductase-like protein [Aureococcus anophagefferens]|nr:Aldo/keto reductase-like protein [Aureococcus anophagefferens]